MEFIEKFVVRDVPFSGLENVAKIPEELEEVEITCRLRPVRLLGCS